MGNTLSNILGIEQSPVSHGERLVSGLGSLIAISAIIVVTGAVLAPQDNLLIVPSMGASAVLLFAVPHGALSQPWNLVGGHLLSAVAGVSCAQLIANEVIAAGLAVGTAVTIMHYARCIHPPGGATALAAVIGGETTLALGYQFVITPVLINVLVILLVAILFNSLFSWRRYPAWLAQRGAAASPVDAGDERHIEHGDLVAALAQIDSFIDVSEHDLLRIYALATGTASQRHLKTEHIRLGHFYSNCTAGPNWSVRRIVDESRSDDPDKDSVVYKVVSGKGFRTSGVMTRTEFAHWARFELQQDEKEWTRIET